MIVVGLWSLGLALCTVGAVFLVQNLTGTSLGEGLVRYWGIIPLLLGGELLLASYRSRQASETGQPQSIRLHGAAVTGLIALVIVAVVANAGLGWRSLSFGFGGSPAYPYTAESSLTETFTPPAAVRVVGLEAPPGHWTISGADVSEVSLEASVRTNGISAEWAARGAEETTVSMEVVGSRLVIRFDVPGHRTSSPPWPEVRPNITGTILVPRGLELDLRTSVARFDVSGFDADVAVRTSTGSIEVRDVNGDVTLNTSTGSLTVSGTKGDIDLRSSTGGITVNGASGRLAIDTSTGRIRVTDPKGHVEIRSSTGGCTVHSDFAVGGNWTIRTSTGHIDLTFPKDSSVWVEAETGTGSISNNLGLPVTGSTRKSMSGTIGDGTYAVKVTASTGSISVHGSGQ